MPDYDLIIRNGTVIDGSGAPARKADVAVRGGRIAAVTENLPGTATEERDATGLLVTPGFVDVHTHYDGQATWDERLWPSSRLGATTVVMGNCGVGFAPCRPEDRDTLISLMEGVEDIPGTALAEGLQWNWESFPDYLDALELKSRDIDIAALFPHGPLRVYAMGERAVNREPATDEDIARMRELLAEGLCAGAMGLATSRTMIHRTSYGDFIPTYQAADSELKQLGEALPAAPGTLFQMVSDFEDAESEFDIVHEIARRTGHKGTFTYLDNSERPGFWDEQAKRLEKARDEGLDIRAQVLSRPLGMIMGFSASLNPFSARPGYKALAGLDHDRRMAELRKSEVKDRILREDNENPHVFIAGVAHRFDKMFPFEEPLDYMPDPENAVSARARRENRSPAEWVYDWLLRDNGHSLIYIPAANFTDAIPDILRHPLTVSALGDGGAHVGSICDASASTYLLTHWVREEAALSLEEGIRMLTRQPAELYSLLDRGLLAEGMKADINIIDFDALNLHLPRIVHDLPAGGRRFLQDADGFVATLVAGREIYRNGEATEALPGALVRGARPDPRPAAPQP
jgi:N-acyl-D-aspartate/D-glutamate deacylase